MATHLNNKFVQIDNALEKYYKRLNIPNYRDDSGVGLFLNYIKTEELNDAELPIENELGDECDPNDCAYIWTNNESIFPIPSYAQIPYNKQETFMFYIIQYCYKHNQPPSDKYIQTTLLNDFLHIKLKHIDVDNGNIKRHDHSEQNMIIQNSEHLNIGRKICKYFEEELNLKCDHEVKCHGNDEKWSKEDSTFQAELDKIHAYFFHSTLKFGIEWNDKEKEVREPTDSKEDNYKVKSKKAKGYIHYIGKKEDDAWMNNIKEHECISKHGKGSNDAIYKEAYSSIKIRRGVCHKISNQIKEKIHYLYPHIVKSTILNKNNEFTIKNGNTIKIVNCNVHHKVTNETLYVVLEPYNQFNYKYIMMDKLFSANDVKNQFNITSNKLPTCYQSNPDIEIQLSKQKDIINFIQTPQFYQFVTKSTPWTKRDKIPIYNTKNNKDRVTLSLSKQQFLKQLNDAVSNTAFNRNNVIPILMKNNNDNDHHVEYVQIVNIQPGCDVGIAYIFDENKQIKVSGIHTDAEFIRSQYQLLFPGNQCDILDRFTCVYDHLTIGNPDLYKNGMNHYEKIYKNRCQKVTDFMKDSIEYFSGMVRNVANVTMENIQMWITKARTALTNKKNADYSLDVSLYDDKHVANFQILMDSPLYIKDLQDINNWYFMQTLNSNSQPIIPHAKHKQTRPPIIKPIPIVIK